MKVQLGKRPGYSLDNMGFKDARDFPLLHNIRTGSRTHPTYLMDAIVLSKE
jgi:hypothetical protein